VFFLNIANDSVMERITLKHIDPISGKNYHLLVNPPITAEVRNRLKQHANDSEQKVIQKLNEYYTTYKELQAFYEKRSVQVNADQDPKAVFETIEFGLVNYLSDSRSDQIRTIFNSDEDENALMQI
jgi:adenylate kinase